LKIDYLVSTGCFGFGLESSADYSFILVLRLLRYYQFEVPEGIMIFHVQCVVSLNGCTCGAASFLVARGHLVEDKMSQFETTTVHSEEMYEESFLITEFMHHDI
jgi:hypothetical protein